ncbi:major facilitator superfamily domain-containing protein [Xylariales sp. PMI_506]|nr:major facilitator superfamily domain-containing protein [Xylariales sp. PMI_506]
MPQVRKKGKTEHIDPLVLPLSDLDRGVVGWDSQDDPRMPLNFPKHRRLAMVMLLAFMTLMAPLSSSIIAPAIASYSAEFHATDDTIADMPVSIFLLGFAVGPLFLAPMSEIYGRVIVLTCSNLVFCLFMIGCALAPSLGSLIAFRFLSGIGGAACLTLGGGVIADMFPVEERGLAMSLWTIGPTVGPSLAPLIGAFIAGSIGWRWAPWIVFIPALPTTIAMAIVFPETNHRVLIQRKVKALRKSLNRPELESCYSTPEIRSMSNWAIIRRGLLRPLKMLCLSPIITVLSIYISFVYGTIYLMYNTVPTVFESVYGWSLGISGLAFLSLGFGYGIGLWLFSFISDRHVVALTARNGGVYKPEMRLPTMVWFAAITPITFFWYGWCAEKHAPWPATVVGIFPLGIGIFGIWMPAQAYIIDAYPQYAASGIAAFTVLRSVTAAFLPLAGPGMFGNLGLGWGNSVLGFICIAMIPIPVIVHRYGERIRKRFPVKL